MKKLLTTFMSMCILSWACTQSTEDVEINLQLEGITEGTEMIVTIGCTHVEEPELASATIQDGKATFKFQTEGPRMFYVKAKKGYGLLKVVADKGDKVTINATVSESDTDDGGKGYIFNNETVSGSQLNEEYLNRNINRESLNQLHQQYNDEYSDVTEALRTAKTEIEKQAIWASERGKLFTEAEKNFFNTVEKTFNDCFLANKDSWWGPLLMLDNMSYLTDEQAPIFEQFTEEAKESFYGKIVHDMIIPPSQEGEVKPDFQFTDQASGKTFTLTEVLKCNKYVLVDFWASWCGPCRKEIPNMKTVYERFHDRGFEIVSISADDNETDWLEALKEEKLPWLNDRDGDKGICRLYSIQYYPTLYLLDNEGKVVAKDLRGDDFAKKMEALLGK